MAMNERVRTRIGYARVSTGEQDATAQIEALQAAGCQRIYTEHASGSRTVRPELDKALDHLRPGDVFTVWKLDRLGRSLPHLIETVQKLGSKQVDFLSLTEAIDTTTPSGRLLFHVAGAFAEFERDLIRERTRAGLAAARAAGRVGGRPSVMTAEKIEAAHLMHKAGKSQEAIAKALGVARTTVRRTLGRNA